MVWETVQLQILMSKLYSITLDKRKLDGWVWEPDPTNFFPQNQFLHVQERLEWVRHHREAAVFKLLWKCKVPHKMSVFCWQTVLGKIATKKNLLKRGIDLSIEEQGCVFCIQATESHRHLFLSCNITNILWGKVFRWIDAPVMQAGTTKEHFLLFRGSLEGKNRKLNGMIIWLSVV